MTDGHCVTNQIPRLKLLILKIVIVLHVKRSLGRFANTLGNAFNKYRNCCQTTVGLFVARHQKIPYTQVYGIF